MGHPGGELTDGCQLGSSHGIELAQFVGGQLTSNQEYFTDAPVAVFDRRNGQQILAKEARQSGFFHPRRTGM